MLFLVINDTSIGKVISTTDYNTKLQNQVLQSCYLSAIIFLLSAIHIDLLDIQVHQ